MHHLYVTTVSTYYIYIIISNHNSNYKHSSKNVQELLALRLKCLFFFRCSEVHREKWSVGWTDFYLQHMLGSQ